MIKKIQENFIIILTNLLIYYLIIEIYYVDFILMITEN